MTFERSLNMNTKLFMALAISASLLGGYVASAQEGQAPVEQGKKKSAKKHKSRKKAMEAKPAESAAPATK
jgi:hypothetical protein